MAHYYWGNNQQNKNTLRFIGRHPSVSTISLCHPHHSHQLSTQKTKSAEADIQKCADCLSCLSKKKAQFEPFMVYWPYKMWQTKQTNTKTSPKYCGCFGQVALAMYCVSSTLILRGLYSDPSRPSVIQNRKYMFGPAAFAHKIFFFLFFRKIHPIVYRSSYIPWVRYCWWCGFDFVPRLKGATVLVCWLSTILYQSADRRSILESCL